ncbi:hypothetical protein D3C78_1734830 [compost metagenome]
MHLSPRLLGLGQPVDEALMLLRVDDGAMIRARQSLGVEAGEVVAIRLDKGLLLSPWQQYIVGGHADLAGV